MHPRRGKGFFSSLLARVDGIPDMLF